MIVNKVKIEQTEFDYIINEDIVKIKDNAIQIEILKRFSYDYFALLVNNKKFVVGINKENNQFQINYKNRQYNIELIDNFTSIKKEMTKKSGLSSTKTTIKAPMPGMVIKINKSINDKVQKGETILIIEAMKMENAIKSPVDGVITTLKVNYGNSVAKNDILVEIE